MARNLLSSVKFNSQCFTAGSGEVTIAAAASATTFLSSIPFHDTQGYDEITFFVNGNGITQIKAQMASTTATSAEDITGTLITATSAAQLVMCSVVKPGKRYVKALVAVTTGAVRGKWFSAMSQPRNLPITQTIAGASGVNVGEIHLSKATGTA